MKKYFEEEPRREEGEQKLHAAFSLVDFRAGHWSGAKTPPWLLNEVWEMNNPEWKKTVEKMVWQEGDELLAGSGVIQAGKETLEVDIYARRDPRRGADYFGFAAYPKGKSFPDFWDEEGREINKDDE